MVDVLPLLASIVTFYGIYLVLGFSFNLEYGFAGQPNLGKVLFYSIGAYAAGRLTATVLWSMVGVEGVPFFSHAAADMRLEFAAAHPLIIILLFFASLAIAALLGGLFGFVVSYPALRLRGDFLAIVLIAVGEVGRVFARTYEPLSGGVFGLSGVPNPLLWLGEPRFWRFVYALIVLAIALITYLIVERLVNSPLGRLLKSVRDDELAAKVYGKDVPRVKAQVLIIGSAMAAVAGALYAFYVQTVFADDFVPMVSFLVIIMVMLGGVANNKGVFLGALLLTLLDRLTRASFLRMIGITITFDITYVRYIAVGVLIILVLMFRPKGLIPETPLKTPALEIAEIYDLKREDVSE